MARRRRRGSRRNRDTAWLGFNAFSFTQTGSLSENVIYSPAATGARLTRGKLKVIRIRGELIIMTAAGTAAANIGGYITTFGTDETETVATGLPWPWLTQDQDVARKGVMWTFTHRYRDFQEPLAPVRIPIDVKVSRMLSPARALFLVIQGTGTNTATVTGHCRALIEKG